MASCCCGAEKNMSKAALENSRLLRTRTFMLALFPCHELSLQFSIPLFPLFSFHSHLRYFLVSFED